jgi:hypothetical protein
MAQEKSRFRDGVRRRLPTNSLLLCSAAFACFTSSAQVVAADGTPAVRPEVPALGQDRYVPAPLDAQEIRGLLGDRLGVNIHKRLIEGG